MAEHVGIVRSVEGNGAALAARFTAHRRSLASILHSGLAKKHRGNPASNIKIEKLYATPVLLSGLASLVLNSAEIGTLDKYYVNVLRNLLKLHDRTPRCVVLFLAGSLPASALLDLRLLGLFAMICRSGSSILFSYAVHFFSSKSQRKTSWFYQIEKISKKYTLPSPLSLLHYPPDKTSFKILAKKKVLSYWEDYLRTESRALRSLQYFKPSYMSLSKPHPLFTSAGSSPAMVSMACVQARMLSGRYRCESLLRHWKKSGSSGTCFLSSSCNEIEDVCHILQRCVALGPTRIKLVTFTYNMMDSLPIHTKALVQKYCNLSSPFLCQFLLDCSSLPDVISTSQEHGNDVLLHLFRVARTWVYSLHRERLKLRDRWRALHD